MTTERERFEIAFKEWVDDNREGLDLDAAEICICEQAFLDGAESRQKEVDNAYWERNRLVAILSRLYPSGRAITDIEGWDAEWHNCIYIDTPKGQLSWHIHDNEMVQFASLPEYKGTWDGHTTEEKYRRLLLLLFYVEKQRADLLAQLDAPEMVEVAKPYLPAEIDANIESALTAIKEKLNDK